MPEPDESQQRAVVESAILQRPSPQIFCYEEKNQNGFFSPFFFVCSCVDVKSQRWPTTKSFSIVDYSVGFLYTHLLYFNVSIKYAKVMEKWPR